MTLKIQPFITEDLFEIEIRPEDVNIPRGRVINVHRDLEGIAYTFRINDKLALIVGGYVIWEGCAQLWAIANDTAKGHARKIRKSINYLLTDAAKHLKIRRYNALINDGLEINKKWATHLGFVPESVMYKACPDGNHMLSYVLWMEDPNGLTR